MGVFVQVNTDSLMRAARPVGYVIQESGCWEWTGAKSTDGYGRFRNPHTGRMVNAHRFMYEERFGALPLSAVCDHAVCGNRACVNPDHLEVVTNRVNVLRGDGNSAKNARKTHCQNGHLLSADNLDNWRSAHGGRACKVCRNARQRAYLKRKATA